MRTLLPLLLLLPAACTSGDPTGHPDLPASVPAALPHAMKGYELYGWERDGEPWFTLVTGTNRSKSFDELDRPGAEVSADGWVRIRVQGVDAARALVARAPVGEVFPLGLDAAQLDPRSVPAGVHPLDAGLLDALVER